MPQDARACPDLPGDARGMHGSKKCTCVNSASRRPPHPGEGGLHSLSWSACAALVCMRRPGLHAPSWSACVQVLMEFSNPLILKKHHAIWPTSGRS